MASTQNVLDHHLQCFSTADLDGILSDYMDESVIIHPGGVIKGKEGMRQFFAAAFEEFSKPGTTFDMKAIHVDGECAYILWDAETRDNIFESATDTFIIRDGKIHVQT